MPVNAWKLRFGNLFQDGCNVAKKVSDQTHSLAKEYESVAFHKSSVFGESFLLNDKSTENMKVVYCPEEEKRKKEEARKGNGRSSSNMLAQASFKNILKNVPYGSLLHSASSIKQVAKKTTYNFSDYVKDVATKSGEYGALRKKVVETRSNTVKVGRTWDDMFEKIDASNLFSKRISPEVRTREFISRQLQGIGFAPKKCQTTFMATAGMILAPLVAGDAWRDISESISQDLGLPEQFSSNMLLITAARRFGKTMFCSMTILNYLISCPSAHMLVWSTSQTTSSSMRDTIFMCISNQVEVECAGRRFKIEDLIVKNNTEQLRIRSPYDLSKISVIHFCPGINGANMDIGLSFLITLY